MSVPSRPPLPLPAGVAPWVAGGLAFFAHLLVLQVFPHNFAYDGFQRWGARDHILVQSWLPATQLLIWGISRIAEDVLLLRVALSTLASLGIALWSAFAEKVGGPVAGWCVVAAATFGPYTLWSSTLYLEGPFFVLLAAGCLALAYGRLGWADLLMGCLALIRYEGWIFLTIYLGWRLWQHRDPWVFRSLWGVALWLLLKEGLSLPAYAASPIDYDDWEGLGQRFDPWALVLDLGLYGRQAARSGATVWAIGAMVVLVLTRRMPEKLRPFIYLLDLLLTCQLFITVAWITGLETAIRRMLVLPSLISVAILALGLSWVWGRLPRWATLLGGGLGLWALAYGAWDCWDGAKDEAWQVRFELDALKKMEDCPDCIWWVEPRTALGSRSRHDGCEVMQGLSNLQHGKELRCARWLLQQDWEIEQKACHGAVIWDQATESYWIEVPMRLPHRSSRDPMLLNLQDQLNAAPFR